jgi:hypothetical protein
MIDDNGQIREPTPDESQILFERETVAIANVLVKRVNEGNYKTPRQFAEDWDLPLREVNRCIKKDWDFLEEEYRSIKLVFPGADPIILLSPKAQDYLKMFTPSGRSTRDTLMSVLENGLTA